MKNKPEFNINKAVIPISIGELLDKISILQVKLEKIKDKRKLELVKDEYNILNSELNKLNLYDYDGILSLLKELSVVNRNLWDIEDKIRLKEKGKLFDTEFIELARAVYYTNDKRSLIKSEINKMTNSSIFEVKQYDSY